MKVYELPQLDQDRLRELMPEEWDVISSLDLSELDLYIQAKLEDADRRLAGQKRRRQVLQEINKLVEPLVDKVGDLPLEKLSWFLRAGERQRYEELMRELKELSRPVFTKYGREEWHDAIERAVPSEPLCYPHMEAMRRHLEKVVAFVLRQDPSWPRDRVRRYARYLIECASGTDFADE